MGTTLESLAFKWNPPVILRSDPLEIEEDHVCHGDLEKT